MKKQYETAMINRGGRVGEVEAPNGTMHLKIDKPGIHSEGTNPEQLFAAGYASCFNGAVQHMLKEHQIESESEVKARVHILVQHAAISTLKWKLWHNFQWMIDMSRNQCSVGIIVKERQR